MEQAQLLLKRYHWVLTLLLLTFLAQAIGRASALLIEGALPAPPIRFERALARAAAEVFGNELESRTHYDIITTRNLFNSNPPADTPVVRPTEGPPIGKLSDKARVRGTIVGESSSMALIEVLAQKQVSVYLVGDLIVEGAEVLEITNEGVVYRQGDEEGLLPLESQDSAKPGATARGGRGRAAPAARRQAASSAAGGIQQLSDTEFAIDRRELENQLTNINQLILQARVVPNFSGGKIDGFKIFAIKPNSIFRNLGLRNGDVLLKVNGVLLDNPQKGLQVFQDLQGQRSFAIDLRRRAQPLTFNYEVR